MLSTDALWIRIFLRISPQVMETISEPSSELLNFQRVRSCCSGEQLTSAWTHATRWVKLISQTLDCKSLILKGSMLQWTARIREEKERHLRRDKGEQDLHHQHVHHYQDGV